MAYVEPEGRLGDPRRTLQNNQETRQWSVWRDLQSREEKDRRIFCSENGKGYQVLEARDAFLGEQVDPQASRQNEGTKPVLHRDR